MDSYIRRIGKWSFEVQIQSYRVIWGFLSSRIGFKVLFFVAASMNLCAFVMIMVTDSETLYLIFYTLNSVSLGGLMVIFPNVSLLIFGKKIG